MCMRRIQAELSDWLLDPPEGCCLEKFEPLMEWWGLCCITCRPTAGSRVLLALVLALVHFATMTPCVTKVCLAAGSY